MYIHTYLIKLGANPANLKTKRLFGKLLLRCLEYAYFCLNDIRSESLRVVAFTVAEDRLTVVHKRVKRKILISGVQNEVKQKKLNMLFFRVVSVIGIQKQHLPYTKSFVFFLAFAATVIPVLVMNAAVFSSSCLQPKSLVVSGVAVGHTELILTPPNS